MYDLYALDLCSGGGTSLVLFTSCFGLCLLLPHDCGRFVSRHLVSL